MLKKFVQFFGGDPNKREIENANLIVDQINDLESAFEALSDEALRAKTDEFRGRFADGETLDDLLPEAFATVREASKRTIGLRHFDVQLIGGLTLHQGKIAEMRTGEGKTLVATLPLYLNALTGRGVHLVTVNDYLARRDARWMAPIYNMLGLSVGVLQMAARTENGKKAFIVDLDKESTHEDQHQLQMVPRSAAYAADITYGTNSEFGFDYLRDNMTMRLTDRVQRGHYYVIIDEVDNVLIDEARTPLIISGPAQDEAEWYLRMAQIVKQLRSEDYEISEKDRTVTLTEIGEAHVEDLMGMPLRDPDRPEDVTPEQARMLGYLEQALRAQYLFHRNKDYLVQAGKVVIIDEFTGRLMPGRRWSDGLHQAVEAKEGVRVQAENVTYATITIQNYYRMYEKLSGMTGTAVTEAEEFDEIYGLEVLAIPTNLEYQALRPESGLIAVQDRDEKGYKYTYYTSVDDPEKHPVFWKRKDYPDVVYRTAEAKLRAIMREIQQIHIVGRPILVGTTSVKLSELLSGRLRAEPLRRLAQITLLRDAWFEKNERIEDGRLVEELHFLDAPLDKLDIAAMRRFARTLGISFNPEEAANVDRLLRILDLPAESKDRLVSVLKAGIPHQVLNARKHTEESKLIERAGAFGAVTIATNMAGRGVDIKLGGELPEDLLANVNRVLKRAGYNDPYDLSLDERYAAVQKLSPEMIGIYETDIKRFIQYVKDMDRVRELGGLHVIGSERHEARRIDNQLRGRAARQGDPGSSRFYLSMEDELMRLFGGQQADSLMQRMKIDDAMPLEVRLVSRIVEQSQTRVEGANFDVRKHLLEYDDVLNTQREKIYAQRNRIFTKEDLSEDVTEMLRTEVNRRVPQALENDEGPWKIIAWLDQIQPPIQVGNQIFPSYTFKLLLEGIDPEQLSEPDKVYEILLTIAEQAITAEKEHQLFNLNMLLDLAQERLESQLDEREEGLENFFRELAYQDESNTRAPKEILDELSTIVHIPLRLPSEAMRLLRGQPDQDDLEKIRELVTDQVEKYLLTRTIRHLIGSMERRLNQPLGLDVKQLADDEWDDVAETLLQSIEELFAQRRERYLGENGLIAKDLKSIFGRINGPISLQTIYQLLILLPQGSKATFDKKTHRRVMQRTTRLTYTFAAARKLVQSEPEEITEQVLQHLEDAQAFLHRAWGIAEFSRIAGLTFQQLDQHTQLGIQTALGDKINLVGESQSIAELPQDIIEDLILELGRQALTEIYRQLLLQVITELWVDYLTQMEALRVSIGLEAYAQRDPLVQYKNRAFELFRDLLGNMRLGVVSRMFTYRPRDMSATQTKISKSAAEPEITAGDSQPVLERKGNPEDNGKSKKRKRRRRRR